MALGETGKTAIKNNSLKSLIFLLVLVLIGSCKDISPKSSNYDEMILGKWGYGYISLDGKEFSPLNDMIKNSEIGTLSWIFEKDHSFITLQSEEIKDKGTWYLNKEGTKLTLKSFDKEKTRNIHLTTSKLELLNFDGDYGMTLVK